MLGDGKVGGSNAVYPKGYRQSLASWLAHPQSPNPTPAHILRPPTHLVSGDGPGVQVHHICAHCVQKFAGVGDNNQGLGPPAVHGRAGPRRAGRAGQAEWVKELAAGSSD
jgi:hypothetical protein